VRLRGAVHYPLFARFARVAARVKLEKSVQCGPADRVEAAS